MSARKKLIDMLASELALERTAVRKKLERVTVELKCDYEQLDSFLRHLDDSGRGEVRASVLRSLILAETFAAIARHRRVRRRLVRRQIGSALRELGRRCGVPAFAKRARREGRTSCVSEGTNARAIPVLRAGFRLYHAEEWGITGAAPKDYLAYGDPQRATSVAFIAKKPKNHGPRECATEAMISEIGKVLPLRVAQFQLARLPRHPGALDDIRFMSQNFVHRGTEILVHGAELVAEWLGTTANEMHNVFSLDDPKEERRFYTVETMVTVLGNRARNEAERRNLLGGFARMLAFDALVGAPDRHGMNWGIIESTASPDVPRRFAPVFDTARGLFWDHPDAHLRAFEQAGTRRQNIVSYADRSRPVFTFSGGAPDRINHFNLARHILDQYPEPLGRPMAAVIRAFSPYQAEVRLRRRFRRVISELRLSYVSELLRYRADVLKTLVRRFRRP